MRGSANVAGADAAAAALRTDSGQYGSNRGPDALLDAFIEHMRQIGLTGYERRNCVTGDGAKHVDGAGHGEQLPTGAGDVQRILPTPVG